MTPEETESRLQRIEALLAETAAIANSNARAIEATANEGNETKKDLRRLVNIVADFAQSTNTRLGILENQ